MHREGEDRNLWKCLTFRRNRQIGYNLWHLGFFNVLAGGRNDGKHYVVRKILECINQVIRDVGYGGYAKIKFSA